ncbi:NAD-dependent epimerase/dehydratase family protein [Arcticibacter eurypsychrophilus]|uniref:NAD-dependent epimerase/dehydratase family protein n=1 Tax=Arcticibacter eurypsychrophilus TaxID=1434752 RepID=UPI00084DE08D|nr:NAD-dependent epimerase/dehydratase family protein [Arcticibacter eurypsychrophilus]
MILVTGATGFLGSELIKQLHGQGLRVRALKRSHSSIPPILQNLPDIEWFNADILDYFALEKAFEGITHVYHCCGLISFHSRDKKNMLRVNMEGTAYIVDLCLLHQVTKLVHVSSVAALGDSKTNSAVTEKDIWEFNGTQHGYSISKYEGEMEVWRGIAEGLNAVIVNPSVIIGKNAEKEGSGKLFDLVSKGISYYTPGTLGLVDVEDVAKVMITLMESTVTSERFIINSANWSYKNLFAETARRLNIPVPKKEISKFQLSAGLWLATLAALFTGKKQDLTRDTVKSAFQNALYSANKLHQFFPDLYLKPIAVSIDEITDHISTP